MTFRELLVWGAFFEGLFVLSMILLLLTNALWRLRDQRKRSSRLEPLHRAISRSLVSGALPWHQYARVNSLPRELQADLFASIMAGRSDSEKQWLRELAIKIGLAAWGRAKCESKLWWNRLQGIQVLALLGIGESIMPKLLADPRGEVRARAAEWASNHPSPEVIALLLDLLVSPKSLPKFAVQDSLIRMRDAVVEPVNRFLSVNHGVRVIPALEVAINVPSPSFSQVAADFCFDEVPLVRARAAALLATIGADAASKILESLLDDPDNQVRASAIAGLRILSHTPAVPLIAPLLGDPCWEVRKQAGQALATLGTPGILSLHNSLENPDRCAADMARQVLDLTGISPQLV